MKFFCLAYPSAHTRSGLEYLTINEDLMYLYEKDVEEGSHIIIGEFEADETDIKRRLQPAAEQAVQAMKDQAEVEKQRYLSKARDLEAKFLLLEAPIAQET